VHVARLILMARDTDFRTGVVADLAMLFYGRVAGHRIIQDRRLRCIRLARISGRVGRWRFTLNVHVANVVAAVIWSTSDSLIVVVTTGLRGDIARHRVQTGDAKPPGAIAVGLGGAEYGTIVFFFTVPDGYGSVVWCLVTAHIQPVAVAAPGRSVNLDGKCLAHWQQQRRQSNEGDNVPAPMVRPPARKRGTLDALQPEYTGIWWLH
jgi:hypothetical protein